MPPSDEHRCAYLGAHIAAGKVFLAQRRGSTLVDVEELQRVEVSDYMDNADALVDLLNRFRQLIRGADVCVVALLHTRQYQQWGYSDAFKRASIQATISIAARLEDRSYSLVRQEDAARKYELSGRWKASDITAAVRAKDHGNLRYWAGRSLAWAATEVIAAEERECSRVE